MVETDEAVRFDQLTAELAAMSASVTARRRLLESLVRELKPDVATARAADLLIREADDLELGRRAHTVALQIESELDRLDPDTGLLLRLILLRSVLEHPVNPAENPAILKALSDAGKVFGGGQNRGPVAPTEVEV